MDERNDERIIRHYDRQAPLYELSEWPLEVLFFKKWRQRFLGDLRGRVLDVGIGTGKNLPYYPKDVHLTGIEPSERMLKRARRRAAKFGKNPVLVSGRAENLLFPDDTFDAVVTFCVLCSVTYPILAVKEMYRVCKKGGKIIMVEHVLSKNKLLALVEKLHNPITKGIFGFDVTRDTADNIKKAGFILFKDECIA
ncbi:class I SAM-dependent methyltransferase [Candidatus Woesearchaeota archaeon]|nr:class I SAM-dependent methyltransferase [Candidatus Woesearchaeota archaeon]